MKKILGISVIGVLCGAFIILLPFVLASTRIYRELTQFVAYSHEYSSQVFSLEAAEDSSRIARLQSRTRSLLQTYLDWQKTYAYSRTYIPFFAYTMDTVFPKLNATVNELQQIIPTVREILPLLPKFLGGEREQKYLVLLQNNMELRPTGGFLGSFAIVSIKNGAVTSLKVEDIYVPDGQLKGYVTPPKPVETYLFQQGGWKLRDSNWDPDFPQTAQTILWFLEKGGYKDIDGVIATNLSVIQRTLSVVGEVYLPDYDQKITTDNLYSFAQVQSEHGFFPGATNKQNVLSALSRAVMRKIEESSLETREKIARTLVDSLATKDTLIWLKDTSNQDFIASHHWDGGIRNPPCATLNCIRDSLYVVEANVGINKTNCCVQREAQYDVWLRSDNTATSSFTLHYQNNNPPTPDPPRYYGGGYNNYLRVYVDDQTRLTQVLRNDMRLDTNTITTEKFQEKSLMSLGFLAQIGGGEQATYSLQFERSAKPQAPTDHGVYQLFIQKQPGLMTNAYIIRLHEPNGQIQEKHINLDRDTTIIFDL